MHSPHRVWVQIAYHLYPVTALAVVQTTSDSSCIAIPVGAALQADSAGAQVGRWGEKVAYLHLREKYKGTAKVEWINGVNESGGPFDVTVR